MNAHLAVCCRACGFQRVYHRGLLQQRLVARGANLTWSELPRTLPCRCGSRDLSLKPSSGEPRCPAMRPYQRTIVRLAVDILERAGQRAGVAEIATIDVRLALHVLRPWVEQAALAVFWKEAVDNHSKAKSIGVPAAAKAVADELRMMGRLG